MNKRTTIFLLIFALAVGAAACAGSSSQTETDDSAEATESPSESDDGDEADKTMDEAFAGAERVDTDDAADDYEVVDVDTLIGAEVQETMPEGCPTEWEKMEARNFDGELYACDGFHAPHHFEEPNVTVGIRDGQIRRVNLQSFHDAGDEIAEMYDRVTDEFQQRCDRTGGAGPRMVLDCGDHLVDIRMQREGGLLNIVYGVENWDLPY